jgi:5-methylcytosine-specific restriction endonuclease McrA
VTRTQLRPYQSSAIDSVPATRAEAFATGADRYFTGQPCKHGHVTERYVGGSCVGCRESHYARRGPEIRARLQAARDADREGVKQRRKDWYERTKAARGPVRNALMQRRFFYARSINLRGPGKATARDLATLWKAQRGICALTGRRLDRSAEIDHIIPKVRGGSHKIGNLRWVVKDANRAKRDLLDADFIALCRDIVRRAGA